MEDDKLMTVGEFNSKVFGWTLGVRRTSLSILSKTSSSGRLAQELGARMLRDKQGGEAYVGLGFRFWKYGAYREYGAGRGYIVKDGIIMKGHSAWRDQKTREKYRSMGMSEYKIRRMRTIDEHYAVIPRSPLPWLDPPITNTINELADISAEFYGDKALKSVLENFDKITIEKRYGKR